MEQCVQNWKSDRAKQIPDRIARAITHFDQVFGTFQSSFISAEQRANQHALLKVWKNVKTQLSQSLSSSGLPSGNCTTLQGGSSDHVKQLNVPNLVRNDPHFGVNRLLHPLREVIYATWAGAVGLGPKVHNVAFCLTKGKDLKILLWMDKVVGRTLEGYSEPLENKTLAKQIAHLVRQLHESGLTHGDLAAHGGNIVVDQKSEKPSLIDFELSGAFPERVWETEQELKSFEDFAYDKCPTELPLFRKKRNEIMNDIIKNVWCAAQLEDEMGVARSTGETVRSKCQGVGNLEEEVYRILGGLK
jgi:serine/threonine protein kinase